MFYIAAILFFWVFFVVAFSLVQQPSSYRVHKASHLMMEQGIIFPVYTLKLVSPLF